eukprot:gene1722-16243_t
MEVLTNGTASCEHLKFVQEPYWITLAKTLCIGWAMGAMTGGIKTKKNKQGKDAGVPNSRYFNAPLALFVAYQCYVALHTAWVVLQSDELSTWAQKAWAVQAFPATLSLYVAALKLFVLDRFDTSRWSNEISELAVIYPRMAEAGDEGWGRPQAKEGWKVVLSESVPRRAVEAVVAVTLLITLPTAAWSLPLGIALTAFPLLPFAPAVVSFMAFLGAMAERSDQGSQPLLFCGLPLTGLVVGVWRAAKARGWAASGPSVLGPLVLLGDLALYCG